MFKYKNMKIPKIFKNKLVVIASLVMIFIGGYLIYQSLTNKTQSIQYATAAIEKGTLIVSVSGSGQISASSQINLTPKASGQLTSLKVTNGQEVKSGTIIAQIDSADAIKAIRDAQISLSSAQLSLKKLIAPTDNLTILQAENSLTQAEETKNNAKANLKKAYNDGFNTISSAFLDLPTIITGLHDVILSNNLDNNQWNVDYYANSIQYYNDQANAYRKEINDSYQLARSAYDENFNDYKNTSRSSDEQVIDDLINQSYETTQKIADAIKNIINLIQLYQDELEKRDFRPQSLSDTHLTSLNAYTKTINSVLVNLLSAKNTITNYNDSISSAERSIVEKKASLEKIEAGADELDIQSQNLSIEQKQNALADAKAKLADYVVRVPFDGILIKSDVEKGNTVSGSTVIATLMTKQRIAEISLNEVDATKVKTGQKATLTFDAVDNLTITGQVVEIDSLGTVSQGVVTYNAKIAFDAQDDRIKPGMSTSASIIVDSKQDVLLAPNSAIKTSGNTQYVEMLKINNNVNNSPTNISETRQQTIQTGLANDNYTEIISGLNEGDLIITKTTTQANAKTTTQTTTQRSGNIFQMGGGGPRD
jgi:HlyD family secretion protein